MFVPVETSQLSLIFAVKVSSLFLEWSTLKDAKIRPGGLTRKKTLAFLTKKKLSKHCSMGREL